MKGVVKKAFEITDARIGFVSLVDKAANKKEFLITKADDGTANFSTFGSILKCDKDKHYITGIVYEPMTEDAHGNYMTEDEIVKAAYGFTKSGNKVDLQHNFESIEGVSVVESWIEKADCVIGETEVKKGTWLMTVEVDNDDIWAAVEKGDLTGFSMGGVGKYSEVDVDISEVEKSEGKGFFKALAKAFGFDVVEKGAVAEKFAQTSKTTLFWEAWYALQGVLSRYNYYSDRTEFETNEETIREALEDFSNIMIEILAEKEIAKALLPKEGAIEKAGKKLSSKNREALQNAYDSIGKLLADTEEKEDEDMNKDEVQKMIDDAIAKALNPDGGNEPKGEGNPAGDGAITKEMIAQMAAEAVKKALNPDGGNEPEPTGGALTMEDVCKIVAEEVQKAMEPVLKAHGMPQSMGSGSVAKSEDTGHYMDGVFC